MVIKSTVPEASGKFSLSPLVAGNYTVVITADARATDVIEGVPVVASASTAISDSAAPIALLASTESTVSGTVLPLDAEGGVSAIQNFGAGPRVTVKYVNADVFTGAYSLTLPVAAPSLGQYTGVLPIVLTAQPAMAGEYSIDVSAAGYQTQSSPNVFSTGAATVDFTLVK